MALAQVQSSTNDTNGLAAEPSSSSGDALRVHEHLFINGRWTAPRGHGSIDVIQSSNEQLIGRIPEGIDADAGAAVAAARAAFERWSLTTPQERGAYLDKIAAGLRARADELADLIAREVGMPLKLAGMIQVGSPLATFASYAKMAAEFEWEHTVGHSRVLREPVGVVACITPWNYPLHQIAAKVGAALAAGCTVVLKPSEIAPLNAFVLAEVIEQAGLPAGVFNLVSGYGPGIGEALVRHPDVDMVSFTGSTRAGRRISEVAAGTIKRVTLELGGKSASVVLDDADLAAAVKGTLNACFLNSGQTCSAHTRMLVPEARYEEAARLAVEGAKAFTVGDPLLPGARLGPLVSEAQRDRVRGYIRAGLEDGAELLCGGADAPASTPAGTCSPPCSATCTRTAPSPRKKSSARSWLSSPTAAKTKPCASRMARRTGWAARCGPAATSARLPWRGACAPARSTSTAAASMAWPRSAATSSRAMAANWAATAWTNSSNTNRCNAACRSKRNKVSATK